MNMLPANPLPTLADEVHSALPALMEAHPRGPNIAQIEKSLGADAASVRRAMQQLNRDARADMMRRPNSREQFLVPFRYRAAVGLRYCAHCGKTFELPPRKKNNNSTWYSNRRTCSRACGIAWSWSRPGVKERRVASIKIERQTPEAKARLAAHNKRRWSRPGEREKLAEQNRREWADPIKKALRAQSIRDVNGSPKMRAFYSQLRKEWWKIPEMREKMIVAAKAAKNTDEYRAYFSELCRQRWRDPVWRKKWLPAVRRNAAKAGKISQQRRRERKAMQEGMPA